jgi:hypothetical protein
MINTGLKDLANVHKLGGLEVNIQYKTLELEVDGVFRSMLLFEKNKVRSAESRSTSSR